MQDNQQSGSQPIYTRTALRRVAYSFLLIAGVMVVGILGFRHIEGMSYVNAVYFESMLATGQGPPFALNTDDGKLFASFMAFVSVGSILTTVFYTLGPFFISIWREGVDRLEKGTRQLEKDVERKKDQSES